MFAILPLFLLSIAISSILLYPKMDSELLRVFAVGTAAVCLIWGFAISHWLVLLAGLVLLLQFKRQPAELKPVNVVLRGK